MNPILGTILPKINFFKCIFNCKKAHNYNKIVMEVNFIMIIDTISLILVIIGALNWGCVGLFGTDVISAVLGGSATVLARIIFSVVGIAGLWTITILFKDKGMKD